MLVGTLVLVAGLVGIGMLIYQAGMAQGASTGAEIPEMIHPFIWGRPLLTGVITILLLLFLLRLVAPLFLFPLFGFHLHRRFPGAPMRGLWKHSRGWDHERQMPEFIKHWHDRLHQDDPSAEALDAEA